MSFWPWALAAYARPGVAAACLDLQDSHGQSVPYLLWAAWAARDGRALTQAGLERGAALALRWEQAAVAPLRLARRGLASPVFGTVDAQRERLRAEVKALELRAEEILMQELREIAPARGGQRLPLEPIIAAASAAWPRPASPAALRRLVQALG